MTPKTPVTENEVSRKSDASKKQNLPKSEDSAKSDNKKTDAERQKIMTNLAISAQERDHLLRKLE